MLCREIGDQPQDTQGGLSLIHPDDGHALEYVCRMQHRDRRCLTFLCKGKVGRKLSIRPLF